MAFKVSQILSQRGVKWLLMRVINLSTGCLNLLLCVYELRLVSQVCIKLCVVAVCWICHWVHLLQAVCPHNTDIAKVWKSTPTITLVSFSSTWRPKKRVYQGLTCLFHSCCPPLPFYCIELKMSHGLSIHTHVPWLVSLNQSMWNNALC